MECCSMIESWIIFIIALELYDQFFSRIINCLIELGKSLGCYKITLNCTDKMITFYERLGFVKEESNANFLVIRVDQKWFLIRNDFKKNKKHQNHFWKYLPVFWKHIIIFVDFLYIFDVYNEIYNGKKLCTFDLMYLYYCSKPNGYFWIV